eukprot:6191298-Pleurochrysis_carterae.AAC.1
MARRGACAWRGRLGGRGQTVEVAQERASALGVLGRQRVAEVERVTRGVAKRVGKAGKHRLFELRGR